MKTVCETCGETLDTEEMQSPRTDEYENIICDRCFEDQYSYLCPICGERVDEDFSERISPKYILISQYASDEIGFGPGIYEILSYPFFADGIIEIHFFESAVRKIADIPEDFDEDDMDSDIAYVCEECVLKRRSKK